MQKISLNLYFPGNTSKKTSILGGNMRLPEHIGVIPDGNRRWALSKDMSKDKGYE